MKNNIVLSTLCTQSVIKANTGKNKELALYSGKGFLFPDNWNIHAKINYKTLSANPSDVYKQREYYKMRFARLL